MDRPRFEVAPFHPDNGAPVAGVLTVLGMVLLGGALAGWLVNTVLGDLAMCCSSSPLQLLIASWGIGALGSVGIRLGRVRSPGFAGVAGLLGMVAAGVGQLYSRYEHDPAGQAAFLDYLETLDIGDLFPIGIGLLLGSGGSYAVMAAAASRPYDTVVDRWKTRVPFGRLRMKGPDALQAISTGDLTRLANVELRRVEGSGVWLNVYVSPDGLPQSTIELELEEVARQEKSVRKQKLGIWTYPGDAWYVLEHLYPGVGQQALAEQESRAAEE